jgi:hypothetical protein
LKPTAKRHAFILLAEALHRAHLNPVEENWETFGFCTYYNELEYNSLAGLYQRLLLGKSCMQIWGSMPDPFGIPTRLKVLVLRRFGGHMRLVQLQLMDSKGYKEDRLQFPFLEEFLSVPSHGPQPSVWFLKQFIAINNPLEHPPIPAVNVDYGFMNCGTLEETCILMEIYKRLLLKATPVELHKGCLEGKLFEFAQRFHIIDK